MISENQPDGQISSNLASALSEKLLFLFFHRDRDVCIR